MSEARSIIHIHSNRLARGEDVGTRPFDLA